MILNYTTTVDAFKTVSEIEYILMKHKAKSIMKDYDGETITGLSFLIDTGIQQIPVRLPVRIDECLKVLKKEKKENPRKQIKDTRDQAERVAWRILKDWVEAQMALLDIEMVRLEEIFLPYIQTNNGQTVYERLEEKRFMLLIWGGRLRDPNKCEKVVARRRIFVWQIRQPEQTATQNKQASGNDLQQDTEGTV